MFNNLPLPKTWAGWLVFVILLLFVFVLYYMFGIQFIAEKYDTLYQTYEGIVEIAGDKVDINLKVPHYSSKFNPNWAYISIVNLSDKEFNDISLVLALQDENGTDS